MKAKDTPAVSEKRTNPRRLGKNFMAEARYLLQADMFPCEIKEELEQSGLNLDNTVQSALLFVQAKKALLGADTDAARFLRDSAGFKPTDQLAIGTIDTDMSDIDFDSMSDEQLTAALEGRLSDLGLPQKADE